MPGKAPVERVGGNQDSGPWPKEVEEIVEGKAYQRPVTLSDGTTQEVEVSITGVNDILDESGVPTGGTAVCFTFDDPTADGGSTL